MRKNHRNEKKKKETVLRSAQSDDVRTEFIRLNRLQPDPSSSIAMLIMSHAMSSTSCDCRQSRWRSFGLCSFDFVDDSTPRRPHAWAKWRWDSMGSLQSTWMAWQMVLSLWWRMVWWVSFDSSGSNRRRKFSFFAPWNRPPWIRTIRSISTLTAFDTRPIRPTYSLRPAPAIKCENVCTPATEYGAGWAIPCRPRRRCIASVPDANWLDVLFRQNRGPGSPCSRAQRVCPPTDWLSSIATALNVRSISNAHCCAFASPTGV